MSDYEASFLEALIASSGAAIVAYDRKGVITLWNPATERMLGWTAAEKVGTISKSSVDPVEVESRARELSAELGRTVHPGLDVFVAKTINGEPETREWTYIAKDGRRGSMTLTVSVLRGPDGRVAGYLSIGRDTSELRAAQASLKEREERAVEQAVVLQELNRELERSNRELTEFASVVAHDLQEPLRAVTNMVGFLVERNEGMFDARSLELARHATDGADRMRRLIDDLLEYARVGHSGRARERVDCTKVLDQALKNLTLTIEETGATVSRGPLPTVIGVEAEVTSLFQNIVGNALKFRSSTTPAVSVEASPGNGPGIVEIRVSDNGIGISPQFADRVFGVFERLHARDHYPGTGIGLAICRKVVENAGGKIWIEPRQPSGTTVAFTLPVAT